MLIQDVSDSDNLKKALVSDFGVSGISSSADATAITIDSSENVTLAGTINGITIKADTTNFTDSILISQNASTGTLDAATNTLDQSLIEASFPPPNN